MSIYLSSPFGVLEDIVHAFVVRRQLETIFDDRARVVAELFPRVSVQNNKTSEKALP